MVGGTETSALPEFGQTVIIFGLPRPTQQSASPALREAVGKEIVAPNLAVATCAQVVLELGD